MHERVYRSSFCWYSLIQDESRIHVQSLICDINDELVVWFCIVSSAATDFVYANIVHVEMCTSFLCNDQIHCLLEVKQVLNDSSLFLSLIKLEEIAKFHLKVDAKSCEKRDYLL